MGVEQRVDEQPALQIGGIGADLAAVEVELARDIVVIEIGLDEAAEHAEHQRVALGQHIPLAHIETDLEVHGLKVAVEIVVVVAAIGARAGAVVAVEPAARASCPHRRRECRRRRAERLAARTIGGGRAATVSSTRKSAVRSNQVDEVWCQMSCAAVTSCGSSWRRRRDSSSSSRSPSRSA